MYSHLPRSQNKICSVIHKYIHNKKAVKNATVGNMAFHMYFMYKPCKNYFPQPISTQYCHYIKTSPLLCNTN